MKPKLIFSGPYAIFCVNERPHGGGSIMLWEAVQSWWKDGSWYSKYKGIYGEKNVMEAATDLRLKSKHKSCLILLDFVSIAPHLKVFHWKFEEKWS